MRKSLFLIFVIVCCTAFDACDKQTDEDEAPVKHDSTIIVPPTSDSSILSVGQAIIAYASYSSSTVQVKGYIVGCVSGTSLNGAEFIEPFSAKSNLLIADDRNENVSENCLPISLPNNSEIRSQLNLVEHPEYLHKQIIIKGTLRAYFKHAGIKDVVSFIIVDGKETPTDSTKQDTSSQVHIPIHNSGDTISGGRIL